MAEILLPAFVTVLFERLASHELLNFMNRDGIDAEMKKWSETLKEIQEVLSDAQEKQITDGSVKLWLKRLQDLAYDLDDVLDDFSTEAFRCKLMAEPQASTSKVRKLIPGAAIKFGHSMRPKIEEINSRFQTIMQQKKKLKLGEIPARPGLNIMTPEEINFLVFESILTLSWLILGLGLVFYNWKDNGWFMLCGILLLLVEPFALVFLHAKGVPRKVEDIIRRRVESNGFWLGVLSTTAQYLLHVYSDGSFGASLVAALTLITVMSFLEIFGPSADSRKAAKWLTVQTLFPMGDLLARKKDIEAVSVVLVPLILCTYIMNSRKDDPQPLHVTLEKWTKKVESGQLADEMC